MIIYYTTALAAMPFLKYFTNLSSLHSFSFHVMIFIPVFHHCSDSVYSMQMSSHKMCAH